LAESGPEPALAPLSGSLVEAFHRQSRACAALGSPFTARLCALVAEHGLPSGAVRVRLADWPGDVSSDGASLPLRLAGALHRLALSGLAFGTIYPPAGAADADRLFAALPAALARHEGAILQWLESPPQTNEVRRASILAAGLAHAATLTPLPFRLLEAGASAGLNLSPDAMAITLGGRLFGDEASPLALQPEWTGPAPGRPFAIAGRAGCDIRPVNLADPEDMLRLRSYVWADQPDRIARLESAAAIARAGGVQVEEADAVDWVCRKLAEPAPGLCTFIFHTIAVQYMPEQAQQALDGVILSAGGRATPDAPVARLSFEADGQGPGAPLILQVWPGGTQHTLARADFHGRWIDWQAADAAMAE
jgi:hypothetical protein